VLAALAEVGDRSRNCHLSRFKELRAWRTIRHPGKGERAHLGRKAIPDEKGLTASAASWDYQASQVRKASAASRDRKDSPAHAASPDRPVNCLRSSR